MARRRADPPLDTDLEDLPPEARWREWMGRVEAVAFAAAQPVPRAVLASLVGRDCNLDQLIRNIRAELRARPYDLVPVAGGWQLRTRPAFGPAIRAAGVAPETGTDLSAADAAVLVAIAYFQPVTRAELGTILGKEIGRDTVARLRDDGLIAPGPRSPQPGAPYTYVTTPEFLARWGLDGLHELPDLEKLRDAGLLSKADALAAAGVPQPPGENA
jgi:chromosome segregation and condensation protein ScpB